MTFIGLCLLGAPSEQNPNRVIWHLTGLPEEEPPCLLIFQTEIVLADQLNGGHRHDQSAMPSAETGSAQQFGLSVCF